VARDPAEAGRGRIVRLSRSAQLLNDGARYAVIVTPNRYALQRRFQQLIPIYDAAEVQPEHGEVVVRAPWTRVLPTPIHLAILAIPSLFTGSEEHQPFVPGHIAAFTRVGVDASTMERIEAALTARFGLRGEPTAP
jgi:hypothetical protein